MCDDSTPATTESTSEYNAQASRSCEDLLAFWSKWSRFKQLNPEYPWAYLYIGHREVFGEDRWKIGVSKHPWHRRGEVGAESIAFSRLVYLPFNLERGLQILFRDARIPWSEWFLLDRQMVQTVMQVVDFWQLMNPLTDTITLPHIPYFDGIGLQWEYKNVRGRLQERGWS